MLYVQSQTPDDGRKDRPKLPKNKINLKTAASRWFYYRKKQLPLVLF
jgi:hypothetical protein